MSLDEIFQGVGSVDDVLEQIHKFLNDGGSLQEIVETPGAVVRLRGKLMRAHGSDGILLLSRALEDLVEKNEASLLRVEPSAVYSANLSYLVPKAFWEAYPYYLAVSGAEFDCTDSAVILSRKDNAVKILDLFISGVIEMKGFSPEFLLYLALASTAYEHPENIAILQKIREICSGKDHRFRLVHLAVTRRLQNSPAPFSETHGGKVAIIVAGQCRGMDKALPSLPSYFDFPSVDFYFSTWNAPGRTSLDRARASRVLEPSALPIADRLNDQELFLIDQILADQSNLSSAEMDAEIRRLFPDELGDRILIADESQAVFRIMSNSAKMYYHNLVWPQTKGAGWFTQNYDYIVKIRPDIKLAPGDSVSLADLRALADDEIGNDHPTWLFEPWGFGVGDQLFYGRADLMEQLMQIWAPTSISARIQTELLGRLDPLQGHVNLGIELWMLGAQPQRIPLTKRGMYGADPITKECFEHLLLKVQEENE